MKKNDSIVLQIEGMTLQGDGIGRCGGVPVFVPGVCPGDSVAALVLKAQKNCAFARCQAVLSPAPARVEPGCAAFPQCGGCAFRCVSYAQELEIKQRETAQTLRRIGGVTLQPEPILGADAPDRYRNKALLPVHEAGGRVRAGYYARHSHRIVHSRDCLLQPALFQRLAEEICGWAEAAHCSVYDETTGRGLLRHIYLRQAQGGAAVLACLVVNGHSVPAQEELIARLRACAGACLRGVLLNHNMRDTNVALGPPARCCGVKTTSPKAFAGSALRFRRCRFFR